MDRILLPRIINLIRPPGIAHNRSGAPTSQAYVDRGTTNIDETACVQSRNQQDQTGKVNEYADADKHCRSKRGS